MLHPAGPFFILLARFVRAAISDVNPYQRGRGVEFVCAHCGDRSLRIAQVLEKQVKVECLSCGKESMVARDRSTTPAVTPPPSRS